MNNNTYNDPVLSKTIPASNSLKNKTCKVKTAKVFSTNGLPDEISRLMRNEMNREYKGGILGGSDSLYRYKVGELEWRIENDDNTLFTAAQLRLARLMDKFFMDQGDAVKGEIIYLDGRDQAF